MFGKIYKIVNDLNDKIYVGQTTQSLSKRFNGHCCNSHSDRSSNMYIKRAILKYGREHFKIELIEECDVMRLDEREIYWIKYYDSFNNGYNLTEGGNSNREVMTASLEETIDLEEFKSFIINNHPHAKEVEQKFNISHSSVYNLIKRLQDDRLVLNSTYTYRISEAEKHKEQLCKMYEDGFNIKDLCKIFHSTKKSVSKTLKDSGIQIQRNRKSNIEYNNSTSVHILL